jgi:hypothetical protein
LARLRDKPVREIAKDLGISESCLHKAIGLRCLGVFVDQPVQDGTAVNLGGSQIGEVGTLRGWPLAQRAMRPTFVVVRGVAGQDGPSPDTKDVEIGVPRARLEDAM